MENRLFFIFRKYWKALEKMVTCLKNLIINFYPALYRQPLVNLVNYAKPAMFYAKTPTYRHNQG